MHEIGAFGDIAIIAGLVALVSGGMFTFMNRANGLAARNARKLDAIMKHLGISELPVSTPDRLTEAVRALIDRGEIIEALRTYRIETDSDLKQAKRAIERYRSRSIP